MRIKFAGGHGLPQRTGETGLRHMLALLAEQKTLTALITKVSPRSVVLEIEHTEIKLPLSAFTPSMVVEALAPGRMMEIERRGETLSFAFVRSRPTTLAEPAEPPTLSSLAEHLPALGIAPPASMPFSPQRRCSKTVTPLR